MHIINVSIYQGITLLPNIAEALPKLLFFSRRHSRPMETEKQKQKCSKHKQMSDLVVRHNSTMKKEIRWGNRCNDRSQYLLGARLAYRIPHVKQSPPCNVLPFCSAAISLNIFFSARHVPGTRPARYTF